MFPAQVQEVLRVFVEYLVRDCYVPVPDVLDPRSSWAQRCWAAEVPLHDLRHTYGSHLVRQGADIATISRQMGPHAHPSITLDEYSHEFAAVQHQPTVAAKLTDAFGGILSAAEE